MSHALIAGPKQEKSSRKYNNEPQLGMREFLQGSPYLRVINLEGIQVVVKKKKKGQGRVCLSSSQSCLSQAALPTSNRFRLPGARTARLAGSCLGGREPSTPNIVCALPHEIGEMVHLQYLGVRCRWLNEIPSSIGNLGNLQTIDVRGTEVRELPESLWKVKTLRHVLGDELAFPRSSNSVNGDDDLKLMHTLETMTIDHAKTGEELRLRFLHRLHVANLDVPAQGEALKSVLKGFSSLKALILSGASIPMDLFAEASEPAPPCLKHVEFLKLDGQLPLQQGHLRLHSCLVDLTHLVLVLRSTKIGQDFIGCIGKLPVLAALELLEGSYDEHDEHKMILGANEFDCLTLLRISGLEGLKKISVPGATTRRNKKKIDTDVPDHVEVVVRVETDRHQQPGTTGSDQQREEGENDQTSNPSPAILPLTEVRSSAYLTYVYLFLHTRAHI